MSPTEIATSIVALNGGRMSGRTRFQKTAYLLDACGMKSGLQYAYHHYGPYSFALSEGWDDAVRGGRMGREEQLGRHLIPYSIFTTKDVAPVRKLGAMSAADARALLDELRAHSDVVLELAATIHFFRQSPDVVDPDVEVRRRKPVKATAENL